MSVERLQPGERLVAEAFLRERGGDWGSGVSLVARGGGGLRGVARLLDPNPGDGHHREHVRELVACGDEEVLGELARAAVAAAGPDLRVEALAPADASGWITALREAGLAEEGRLPEGLRGGEGPRELVLLGRPGTSRGRWHAPDESHPSASLLRGPSPPPGALIRIAWSDGGTRPALARFIKALVPGRAYPPGTLLSEAERAETTRPGALDAPWLLALDEQGEVAGVLVLESAGTGPRSHVRRIHLDVAPAHRGAGIACALVRTAIAESAARGASCLEADPRSGNLAVIAALRRAGMSLAACQVRAWRMRSPAHAWDEDVLWLWASCL